MFGSGGPGGGITNTGAISASNAAIEVSTNVGSFAGGINNSGKLTAAGEGIVVESITFFGDVSAGGGIVNSGTISANRFGIDIVDVAAFYGGISNSGNIFVSLNSGASSAALFGNSSAGGGIVNSGTVAGRATAIGIESADGTATFAGGISNSGKIASTLKDGILVSRITVLGAGSAGGIVNAGVISAGASGIDISQIAMISSGIVNSGTIAGKLGIGVFTATVAGGIIDSGSIIAATTGISIDGLSEVRASKTAIDIAGPTFTGGIRNTGVVSGSAGIEIKSAHGVSIFDGGTIIGAGGTAIEFAGSGNTLTLGAGYFISGIVDPQSGNNTFQLGGDGSDTFDLSSIGATAQSIKALPSSTWSAALRS
jgi:hypothetical protein